MADSSSNLATDAFLTGRGIPVAPEDVEEELARLWGPDAERAGGPEPADPHVTRVATANLVVADLEGRPGLDEVLGTVSARRPSRAIVLRPAEGQGSGPGVSAEVSATCQLPAPGRPQVCSEQIVLRAASDDFGLLPGAVLGLLEADLPTALWWAGDPRPAAELHRVLAGSASRLIADLPDPESDLGAVTAALEPSDSRDVAWLGLGPWRELVAGFFDPPGASAALRRIVALEVDAVVPVDGPGPPVVPRAAAWIAAWIAGQLGWRPSGREAPEPSRIAATFEAPAGPVAVTLRALPRGEGGGRTRLRRVLLVARPPLEGVPNAAEIEGEPVETFGLERPRDGSDAVRVETCSASRCALPGLVHSPDLDDARTVAAALESGRDDPAYRAALPLMLWLLGVPDGRLARS